MKIVQVDAFTGEMFEGNPAAVCVLEAMPSDELMQNIAVEMNLSETAFLLKEDDFFHIKWFTPDSEEDLCGHATLSAAHVLFEQGIVEKSEKITFKSRSGELFASFTENGIMLDFPAEVPKPCEIPEIAEEALGTKVIAAAMNRLDIFLEIEDEEHLKNFQPNLDLLKSIKARGVVVTAKSQSFDFVSRFFCPNETITEDPVTGSAHCGLAPLWSEKLGKTKMTAKQVSKRGGILHLDYANGRVSLTGQAVTVMNIDLLI